jgi:hypothetical protein
MSNTIGYVGIAIALVSLAGVGALYTDNNSVSQQDIEEIQNGIEVNHTLLEGKFSFYLTEEEILELTDLYKEDVMASVENEFVTSTLYAEHLKDIDTIQDEVQNIKNQLHNQEETLLPTKPIEQQVLLKSINMDLETLNKKFEKSSTFERGDIVHIQGVNNTKEDDLTRIVIFPDGTKIESGTISASQGNFTTTYVIPNTADLGTYEIQIKIKNNVDSIKFKVE